MIIEEKNISFNLSVTQLLTGSFNISLLFCVTGLNEYTEGVAIVTGGNRGIGLETVKRLVEHGLKVIVGK